MMNTTRRVMSCGCNHSHCCKVEVSSVAHCTLPLLGWASPAQPDDWTTIQPSRKARTGEGAAGDDTNEQTENVDAGPDGEEAQRPKGVLAPTARCLE